MRHRVIVAHFSVALLSLPIGTLCAEPPAPGAAPVAEEGLVARWPAKAAAEDQEFDGSRFVAWSPAAKMGQGPFSVSVWVHPCDLAGGNSDYGRGIARSTRGEQVGDWLLSVHRDGRVRFCNWRRTGADADGSHLTRRPAIQPEAWFQVVATWDGKATHLFVNGVEFEHDPGTTASGWETGHDIGRSWTQADYYWAGRIDDLRVYRRALTAAEVKKAFQFRPSVSVRPLIQFAGDPKVSDALDSHIRTKLHQHHLLPAPPADDAEFCRRVTLDLAGRIPTQAETEAFLADQAPDKRQRLIDTFLGGREMPIHWSQVLSGWLMPKEGRRDPRFVGYLRNGLARNKPWDSFVRDMLLARPTGSADQYAGNFLTSRLPALKDQTIARDVARVFFGVNLRCAQCHDHPQVKQWTRARFFGLSAFFVRSYEFAYTNAGNEKVSAIAEKAAGELEYAGPDNTKKVVAPVFLDGKMLSEPPATKNISAPAAPPAGLPPAPAFSRRESLARVALDPGSPFVKRAIVNRVWQRLMGRALVEPVDMMHDGNPPTHPEILDLLADDFADHGFDLRRLIAVIMHSQAYARSGRWPGSGEPPNSALYAVAILKPLDADQLALSLPLATGYYDSQLRGDGHRTMAQIRPVAPWTDIVTEFDPAGEDFEPTAAQALFLLNSESVQTNLLAKSNLAQTLSALPDDHALARGAYLSILSRLPLPEETMRVRQYLHDRGSKSRAEACRELVWALVSSAEFRFNH